MSIKTGVKGRLRIAGLFLYLTMKYFTILFFILVTYNDMYLKKGCTEDCFLVLASLSIWAILGIIEWVLYGKIVWKYELRGEG